MIPTPLVPASPSQLPPQVCRWEASGSKAASCAPWEKRSLPLAFLAGYPLNSTVFPLGWVTESGSGVCALQLVWPVSCAATSPISAFHPQNTKGSVCSGSSKATSFIAMKPRVRERKGLCLWPSCPHCSSLHWHAQPWASSCPTWPPMLAPSS